MKLLISAHTWNQARLRTALLLHRRREWRDKSVFSRPYTTF